MPRRPQVLTEAETLERAHAGASLARYGDGELRLCLGGHASAQQVDRELMAELRSILRARDPRVLVCIPNYATTIKPNWKAYEEPKWLRLYEPGKVYGSAFITRPDSAPQIDTKAYWDRVVDLWRDRDVVLVAGNRTGLRPEQVKRHAANVVEVAAPVRDAYADVNNLESRIAVAAGPDRSRRVLLCLGPTATVLAYRLAQRGVHALDLGHIGMFMRRRGVGTDEPVGSDLITPEYLALNRALHDRPEGFGGSGWRHGTAVIQYARALNAGTVLDYGCGEGTLAKAIREAPGHKLTVREYDPAVGGKHAVPTATADLVVCTDVLEHVEPPLLQNVLRNIRGLARKGAYFSIACRLAGKTLPDGRNAHQIVEQPEWWLPELKEAGFRVDRIERVPDQKPTKQFHAWCT